MVTTRYSSPTRALAVALVITGALAAGPVAEAATQFTFAQGGNPETAVDEAGTAHVSWWNAGTQSGTDDDSVRYCRIARGTRACSNAQALFSSGSGNRVVVTPSGEVLAVVSDACGQDEFGLCTYLRRSADGGVTFGPSQRIAFPNSIWAEVSDVGDLVVGPGNSISWVNGNGRFTNAALDGGTETDYADLGFGGESTLGLASSTPVVAYITPGAAVAWRAYDGNGDLNSASNWTPAQTIEPQTEGRLTLAGGPSGLFLLYERQAGGGQQWVVRKFAGSGWMSPVAVTGVGDVIFTDLHQDSSGRLHFVGVDNADEPNGLVWRGSADGVSWTSVVLLNRTNEIFPKLNVAAAGDGQGFVAWDSGQGPSSGLHDLRAIPIEPFHTGGGAGDPCQPPGCEPIGGTFRRRAGGTEFTEEVEIPSCQKRKVTLRVKVKRVKRTGNTVVKVRKVVFRLDRQKRKTDKRAPYRAKYSLQQHGLPNSLHTAKAKVHYTVKKGKQKPVKNRLTLKKRFRLCPLSA